MPTIFCTIVSGCRFAVGKPELVKILIPMILGTFHQQRVKTNDFHIFKIHHHLINHVHSFGEGKQGLFAVTGGCRHNYPVEKFRGSMDQVKMAIGYWVKSARINCRNIHVPKAVLKNYFNRFVIVTVRDGCVPFTIPGGTADYIKSVKCRSKAGDLVCCPRLFDLSVRWRQHPCCLNC